MPTPAELTDWDLRHFWHSFTQMSEYEPMVIERAEGSWLVDVQGRRYLDGVSSLWCNLLGHRHPRIEAAIVEQLGKLPHATTLGMSGQGTQNWPIANVRGSAILADIVYRPLETEFLRAGRARGLVTMDGLGMLIHQGARAFELWFGIRPDAAKARARLLAALGA